MSNKKGGPKLFKKLSSRFKKRKDNKLKAIKESAQNPELDNVGSNSNAIRVKGSVRRNDMDDEKLLKEMKIEFKDPEFDSVQSVMDHLPPTDGLTMDYLVEKSQYYKEYADAVERTFKKRLMDNSHSFIIGMQQIQDVKLDLHLTNVLCRNARRTLQESDKSLIHKCFSVMNKYQRRKRMVDTLKTLYEIQKLKDFEQEFHKFLDANDFINAIDIHQQITTKIFGVFQRILCLELMRKRFRDGTKVITNKLSTELLILIYDAPCINLQQLEIIFESYFKLSQFHLINSLVQDNTIKILTIKCTQIVCKHNGYNRAYIDRNYGFNTTKNKHKNAQNLNINTYRALCKKLKPQSFMLCFMDICGRVFDILHLYYKIESFLIKFRAQHNIQSEDMNTLVRKSIWNETQNLLGGLLECSQFSLKTQIKMEDLLLALHGASIFKIIGQSFSGSESLKLTNSIRKKCTSYLLHFRKTFWESMKTNFDNEMWVVLPIPSNFGIHSIKELQRNTQWTIDDESEDSHGSSGGDALKNEISIYQKLLSGENIFDKLCAEKTQSDLNKKRKPSNIFMEIENNNPACLRPSDDGSEPCLTSTSLNLAKFIGKCLQIMDNLSPVSYEAFIALRDSFKFYLYHVFIWFGVNVHNFFEIHESEFSNIFDTSQNNYSTEERERKRKAKEQQTRIMSIAQKKYPILTRVINQVNELLRNRKLAPELEDLIQKKLKNATRRPRKLPHFGKCYMEASSSLQLDSQPTMQGVAARFVATETLPFLVSVIKSQHGRLINILNKADEVSSFICEIENVVTEFKKYMYRNVPTLLVHLGNKSDHNSIISHIHNTNWNMRSLKTEPNPYVSELISIFTKIENVLSSFPTLPKFIHFRLNREAIIYVEEQLVSAYADCKKCTTEGRALMSLDQSVLKKSYPICKYKHSWEYTTNFIQAYYLPASDLIEWIAKHPQYPLQTHKSFLKIGRASESLRRKEKLQFAQDIERVYVESKKKELEKLRQQQLNKQNKPNLKEINQILLSGANLQNKNDDEEKIDTNGSYQKKNNNDNDAQ